MSQIIPSKCSTSPPSDNNPIHAQAGIHDESKLTRRAAFKLSRSTIKDRCLEAIRNGGSKGLTRDELATLLQRPVQSICGPVIALLDDGLIVETHERGKTRWGSPACVLKSTEALYA